MAQPAEKQPIERGFFRDTEDGATVFFPYGLTHRGYVLPDDAAKKRALRAISLCVMGVMSSAVWLGHVLAEQLPPDGSLGAVGRAAAGPLALLMGIAALYVLWAWRFTERFPESDLQVPQEERFREAAQHVPPWKVVLLGVGLVAASAVLVWLDPRTPAWFGVLGIVTGLGLVLFAWKLRGARDGA